jgi:N-succinyldiaminopimelate aminotransferase
MPRFPLVAETSQSLSDRVFGQLVAKAKARGGTFHALHVGDTYMDPLPAARAEAMLSKDFARLHNYAPVQGEPALLDAILRHVKRRAGVALDRELVQVMSGATAGIAVVVDTLLSPGDELVLLAPYWPLVRGTCARRGVKAVEAPFFDRLASLPTAEATRAHLEQFASPKSAAIYVNSPHNPTGAILAPHHVEGIARFAEAHGLWIVSDEVYEELWFESAPEPVWTHPRIRPRAVVVHSISKAYGMAGARVGFAHGPAEAMAAIRGVQTFVTYCAPRPFQLAAARVLDEGQEWIAEARRHYRELGHRAADALGVPPPPAGTFLFVDVSRALREGESDATALLERALDAGVLLTPGTSSGKDYGRWIRLCFTTLPPAELDEALRKLRPVVLPGPGARAPSVGRAD